MGERSARLLLALAIGVAAVCALSSRADVTAEGASTAEHASATRAAVQTEVDCPAMVGGLHITPFQQRSNSPTASQYVSCTYVAPVGSIGQARLLLRWNDPAGTVSQRCHSATELRLAETTSGGADQVTLWSATNQIQVEAVIIQAGALADINAAEAAAAAWLAANESNAIPCAPEPAPIEAGSLECPLRIGELVWLGYYSSGDIGHPEERSSGGRTIPGFQLRCDYRAAYDDIDGRANIIVIWVEPGPEPPRDEDCRDYGRDRTVYSGARAASGSYGDPARYSDLASEDAVREAMLALFATAETRAVDCPVSATATPTAPASATATATAAVAAESCAPSGVVTDDRGDPMPGLRVQLHLNGQVADQRVTDTGGAFRFEELDFFSEAYDFDLGSDEYEVGVVLRDAVEGASRFEIRYGSDGVLPDVRRLPKTVAEDPDCENDFAFSSIDDDYRVVLGPSTPEEWRSLAFSYQHLRIGWNFATEVLGVTFDNDLPLRLFAYCSGHPEGWWAGASCGSGSASYLSAVTQDREELGPPAIQFSRGFSRRVGGDRPVNGEYHELGHAVMSDSFGDLMPGRADHTNHAGYVNPTSTDSWTEGFAEWFGTMVAREQGAPKWWLYPVSGLHSLEDDRQPTGAGGRDEELSIAGILVDMVDSDADYEAPERRQLTVLQGGFIEDPDDPEIHYYAVEFRNDTGVEQRDVAFKVDYGGVSGVFTSQVDGLVDPVVLGPGETGQGMAVLPPSVTEGEVNSVLVVGFSTEDDEGVSHSPREVWDAIVGYRGTGEPGNGYVIDVSELYEALITGFPEEADAIDQIFLNHGWYADLGEPRNGQHDAEEPIGVTSRDGTTIRTAPERNQVFDARLDTGAVATSAFVEVLYPTPREGLSYAFEAPVDEETGTVAIAVPPPETGAVVRIVLRADGYLPVVLDDIEAGRFWEEAAANDYEPFTTLTATMVEGDPFGEEGGGLDTTMIAAAAGGAVLVIVVLFLGARRLGRGRGTSA